MWVPLLACPAVRLSAEKTLENDDRKHCWASQQWHPTPDIDWWGRLPACLLGMTGKMPVATKSFSSAITFESRYNSLTVGGNKTSKHSVSYRNDKPYSHGTHSWDTRKTLSRQALRLASFFLSRKAPGLRCRRMRGTSRFRGLLMRRVRFNWLSPVCSHIQDDSLNKQQFRGSENANDTDLSFTGVIQK
jgi:hypothetical protein